MLFVLENQYLKIKSTNESYINWYTYNFNDSDWMNQDNPYRLNYIPLTGYVRPPNQFYDVYFRFETIHNDIGTDKCIFIMSETFNIFRIEELYINGNLIYENNNTDLGYQKFTQEFCNNRDYLRQGKNIFALHAKVKQKSVNAVYFYFLTEK